MSVCYFLPPSPPPFSFPSLSFPSFLFPLGLLMSSPCKDADRICASRERHGRKWNSVNETLLFFSLSLPQNIVTNGQISTWAEEKKNGTTLSFFFFLPPSPSSLFFCLLSIPTPRCEHCNEEKHGNKSVLDFSSSFSFSIPLN